MPVRIRYLNVTSPDAWKVDWPVEKPAPERSTTERPSDAAEYTEFHSGHKLGPMRQRFIRFGYGVVASFILATRRTSRVRYTDIVNRAIGRLGKCGTYAIEEHDDSATCDPRVCRADVWVRFGSNKLGRRVP